MLKCGLNCKEFTDVASGLYVQIASEQFGIRGRPTSVSRVAALTGLSRRAVSKIRSDFHNYTWSPDFADSPINTVIHYWRYADEFSLGSGVARDLDLEGMQGFSELARKYVSGIPASTLRRELLRMGVAEMTELGKLSLKKNHAYPTALNEDYVRNWAFSLSGLGSTLSFNSELVEKREVSEELHVEKGRFEQVAWSRRLSAEGVRALQTWVRSEGRNFVQSADSWIAENEVQQEMVASDLGPVSGVGVYFFVGEQ